MPELPTMPANFWPDLMVVGEYSGAKLAFVLTEEGQTKHIDENINQLRYALWQAVHLAVPADGSAA